MERLILCFFAIIAVISCTFIRPKKPYSFASCPFPNGTDTAMHIYNCDGDYAITTSGAQVFIGNTTQTMYPIDPRKPMTLALTAYNKGVQINDNKANVTIFEYQDDWATKQCKWNSVPTFGLLNGIDGCDYAHNCPLTTGPLTLRLPLDLSGFSAIINLLAANVPYQLHIEIFNYNSGSNDGMIACVVAQVRFEETN
uniref:MD-2-related lipid-recognition domain-containing protein n=1 Tax=Acrobeloides nanus TaxID=290746 RepID=A0A914DJK9_9BILA